MFVRSEWVRLSVVVWGMILDSETSSIPELKSHTMISLYRIIHRLTWTMKEKSYTHKSISILKKCPMSDNIEQRETAESAPHKSIQPKFLSPFAEFLDANSFVPSHARTGLPPYHDILHIHCTRKRHLGGTGAVEVGKTKRSGSHIRVEVASPETKDVRVFWVGCQPLQRRRSVAVPSAVVEGCPRWDRSGGYGMPYPASAHYSGAYRNVVIPVI